MPDELDRVQDLVLASTEATVARMTRHAVGAEFCDECGEPISEYRQALGARLCVPHQEEAEQRAKHQAVRRACW